jgi:hypothetical protein
LNHFADEQFWLHYRQLPDDIRLLADKNFALLRADPRHTSVRLKKVGVLYSARIGLHYRGLAKNVPMDCNRSGLGIIRLTIGCSAHNSFV